MSIIPVPRLTVTVDLRVVYVRIVGCVAERTHSRLSYLFCGPLTPVSNGHSKFINKRLPCRASRKLASLADQSITYTPIRMRPVENKRWWNDAALR